ncbi:MAG: LicD family protein [Muribaculaceae bacterium]|nr:LicD family protein [Muribaculaceae bacterium]
MISPEIQIELRRKYNPDGSDLRNLQLRMLRMLEYFDAFCKKHSLTYWLSSGTCLGAIRHQGFIPWDDDLDIEMFPEDYKRLLSLKEDFEDEFHILQDFETDKEYITPYGKVRDKESFVKEIHNRDLYFNYRGVFIDILIREKGCFACSRIAHICQYFSYWITNIKNNKIRKAAKFICYNFMHKALFPILRKVNSIFGEKGIYRYALGSSSYERIHSENIFPLKEAIFEGKKFPVPGNVDDYLRMIYGDYNSLPNLKNFRIHFTTISIK